MRTSPTYLIALTEESHARRIDRSETLARMSYQNGYVNGGVDIPRVIEVPLKEDPGSTLEIDCETLEEDTSELCEILNSEEVSLRYWIKFAVSHHFRRYLSDYVV